MGDNSKLAVTAAVSCVALTKVVVSAVLPKLTTAPDAKALPVTVRVNAGSPAVADVLLRLPIAGGGAGLIVNVNAKEVLLPGFTAITAAVPACARSEAGTSAVTWVTLTKWVVKTLVFH